MRYAMTAVIALAAGAGIMAAADARGINQQSAAPPPAGQMLPGEAMQREFEQWTVRQAQQFLKSQGLYDGTIDGRLGPQTRQAVSSYQLRNGLPDTAKLDDATLTQMSSQGIGVGSSTPQNPNN